MPDRKSNRWATDQNNENLTTYKSNVNVSLVKTNEQKNLSSSSVSNSPSLINSNNKVIVKGGQRWDTPSTPISPSATTSFNSSNQTSQVHSSSILGMFFGEIVNIYSKNLSLNTKSSSIIQSRETNLNKITTSITLGSDL